MTALTALRLDRFCRVWQDADGAWKWRCRLCDPDPAPFSGLSLIERARLRVTMDDAEALLTLYRVGEPQRAELLELIDDASKPIDADAFSWLTSHVFRKTTATILDDAGQSARQIADQLGHARPSMTQDVYMGRKAKNPAAATALEHALGGGPDTKTTP